MLFYNGYNKKSGSGYKIIKVTVGEANHVTQMSVAKSDSATDNSTVSTSTVDGQKIVTVKMDAATTAAKAARASTKSTEDWDMVSNFMVMYLQIK